MTTLIWNLRNSSVRPLPSIVNSEATQFPSTFLRTKSKPLPGSTRATTPHPTETLSTACSRTRAMWVSVGYPHSAGELFHPLAVARRHASIRPRRQGHDDCRLTVDGFAPDKTEGKDPHRIVEDLVAFAQFLGFPFEARGALTRTLGPITFAFPAMLGVSPGQLGSVERLAVDRDQPSPRSSRRVLTYLEGLHRPDRYSPEHRDIDVATLLDVVEIHGLGIFASNDFSVLVSRRHRDQ